MKKSNQKKRQRTKKLSPEDKEIMDRSAGELARIFMMQIDAICDLEVYLFLARAVKPSMSGWGQEMPGCAPGVCERYRQRFALTALYDSQRLAVPCPDEGAMPTRQRPIETRTRAYWETVCQRDGILLPVNPLVR